MNTITACFLSVDFSLAVAVRRRHKGCELIAVELLVTNDEGLIPR